MPPAKISAIKPGKVKNAEGHTSPSKRLHGDSYPTGIRNPEGKSKGTSSVSKPLSKAKLKIPPKKLA